MLNDSFLQDLMAIDSKVYMNGEKGGNWGNVDNWGNIDPLFIVSSNNNTASLVTDVFPVEILCDGVEMCLEL